MIQSDIEDEFNHSSSFESIKNFSFSDVSSPISLLRKSLDAGQKTLCNYFKKIKKLSLKLLMFSIAKRCK